MAFAMVMASGAGRLGRVVAGLVLIAVGLYLQNAWGVVVAVIGMVPLLAGAFNYCVFAPIFAGPFNGRRLTSKV